MILIWTFLSVISMGNTTALKPEQKVKLDSGLTTIQLLGLDSQIEANIVDSKMFYRLAEQKDKTLLQNKAYLQNRDAFFKNKDLVKTQIRNDLSKLIETKFSKKELELLNTLLKYEVYSRMQKLQASNEFQKVIDAPIEKTHVILNQFSAKSVIK